MLRILQTVCLDIPFHLIKLRSFVTVFWMCRKVIHYLFLTHDFSSCCFFFSLKNPNIFLYIHKVIFTRKYGEKKLHSLSDKSVFPVCVWYIPSFKWFLLHVSFHWLSLSFKNTNRDNVLKNILSCFTFWYLNKNTCQFRFRIKITLWMGQTVTGLEFKWSHYEK